MANRSSGPEVYNYNSGNSGRYDSVPPYFVPQQANLPQQSVISQPSSNLVSADSRPPAQQAQPTQGRVSAVGSNNSNQGNSKYEQYRAKSPEYKYNLFSVVDQPWNRCCEVGTCGPCPGNECVAKRQPRFDWM